MKVVKTKVKQQRERKREVNVKGKFVCHGREEKTSLQQSLWPSGVPKKALSLPSCSLRSWDSSSLVKPQKRVEKRREGKRKRKRKREEKKDDVVCGEELLTCREVLPHS